MKTCRYLLLFFLSFGSFIFPQISLTGSGAYLQDFNTLAATGSSSALPAGWHLFESGTSANTEYTAGTGSASTGDTYSYGSTDDSDRALGSLRTGSLISTFGANFINNTGEIITSLHVTYTGEQWRSGATNRNAADRLDFQYSVNATTLSDGDWTDVDQLDFQSPNINTSAGTLNGNSIENRSVVTYVITGLSIPDDAEFWIRWTDFDIAASDDGLAIDDFSIDVTAPSVVFSINPTSLDFGNVSVGSSEVLQVTVENLGTTDNLEISNMVSSNPEFTFTPNSFPVVIAPSASQIFNITYSPLSEGESNGEITFTHNAAGSPAALTLTGTGEASAQGGLLRFKSPVRNLLDGTTENPDTIVLAGYSGQPLKALQFNLLVGKTNGKLILKSIDRGSAIPADQFNLSYEIYEGAFLPDGSKVDTVKVVILGNGSNAIQADSDDQDILIFTYDILNIVGNSDQTFNGLSEVIGATISPVSDANISTGPDEIINIFNGTLMGLLGDLNLDNNVNILDILTMIDYMLGRINLSTEQFEKADIAPWGTGNPLPTPDGIINVLDLAVLQNIVLTGLYPGGGSIHKPMLKPDDIATTSSNKLSPGMNAKLTFYLTAEGITIGLESDKKVKGLQIELSQLSSVIPPDTKMNSVFDQAYYYQDNSFLRIISYDGKANTMDPGQFIVAGIPFTLSDPSAIAVDNVIVADENNNAMQKVEIEILHSNPALVIDYKLFQNFPNPFNPSTLISFSVPKDEFVTIKIYDMIGQEIKTLVNGDTKAGTHLLNWDGLDNNGMKVSSGSYIYRMTAGEFVQARKMILLK